MKNRKGQTIPQPYLDLAMMRREQQELSEGMKVWYKKLNNNIENSALNEALKKEHEDIDKMYLELLEIHQKACAEHDRFSAETASSLAELEAWRKAKLIDYKTMYEDLLDKLEFYKKAFEGLKTTVEQNLPTAELQSTERNYVWEAALAIYAANRGVMGIEYAFDKANEFVAEGKKRNHI